MWTYRNTVCCRDEPNSFISSSRRATFIVLCGIVFSFFVFKLHTLSIESSSDAAAVKVEGIRSDPLRVPEHTCPSYWKRKSPKCCDGHRGFSVDYTHNSTDCVKLHYADTDNYLPRTALASFPGSGSHWLRHLIQQTTGNKCK